ncbi:MAG: EamA family transporter, partial [Anaerolineae bacterium]|nr:EamA family transporter [Anaerolineae bacterium]
RSHLSLIAYLWIVFGSAAIMLLIWCLLAGLPLTGYTAPAIFWMVALGLIPQLVGHTAANYAIRFMSATFVSITILAEPIGSTLLAVLLLNETPVPLELLGGGLILAGIAFSSLKSTSSIPDTDSSLAAQNGRQADG